MGERERGGGRERDRERRGRERGERGREREERLFFEAVTAITALYKLYSPTLPHGAINKQECAARDFGWTR